MAIQSPVTKSLIFRHFQYLAVMYSYPHCIVFPLINGLVFLAGSGGASRQVQVQAGGDDRPPEEMRVQRQSPG